MILNLTQHLGTPEQGVTEPEDKAEVQRLLTFESIPTRQELIERALKLTQIARLANADQAMIGGPPFFMSLLEKFLSAYGMTPLYAFSLRRSEEEHLPDGTVRKVQVFKHIGFVKPVLRP